MDWYRAKKYVNERVCTDCQGQMKSSSEFQTTGPTTEKAQRLEVFSQKHSTASRGHM